MMQAGGSHAQRDLFEQILLDTAIRGGHSAVAQQALELRRRSDPDGAPVNSALAAVYTELGLHELADQARSRAARTRARHHG
jgi:Flp pilus assembly protein TadD